jgi:transcriptional regulator with XRE-family HTH domain
MSNRLFPALLKYWRGRRGLSQLELALAADVSARHISYMETGRAQPSEAMVLRLMETLGVPKMTLWLPQDSLGDLMSLRSLSCQRRWWRPSRKCCGSKSRFP